MRLHTRSIVRDGRYAFIGSQSLRQLELDARREVGIIFRDPTAGKAHRRHIPRRLGVNGEYLPLRRSPAARTCERSSTGSSQSCQESRQGNGARIWAR